MNLDEYKLLFVWIKQQGSDEDLNWNCSLKLTVPVVWEYAACCHTGEFFLRILKNLYGIFREPNYFFMPGGGDVVLNMFKQIKKFLLDHFLIPDNLLARLNLHYSDESCKWELCELIFFIAFISSSGSKESFIDQMIPFQESFPLALKLSLNILLRTLDKMKIQDSPLIELPQNPIPVAVEFSSTKKRRQEELIRENTEQRSIINDMKEKNNSLEVELRNLKNSLLVSNRIEEDSDMRYLNKIYMLEKIVNKNQDYIDEKNREIFLLKKEKNDFIDQIEIYEEKINSLELQISKLREINKKQENVALIEEKMKKYEKKLQEAYQDKDLLILEIRSIKKTNKNIEILEQQLSAEIAENADLNRKLAEIVKKYEDLSNSYNELVKKFKLLEDCMYLADNQSSISLAPSQLDFISLETEELQVKSAALERENERLKLELKEKDNQIELDSHLKTFGTSSEVYMLKYSRLECELLETRLNFTSKVEELNSNLKICQEQLIESNHDKDLIFNENIEIKNKLAILEKQLIENTQIIAKLRQENVKLREQIDRLKVNSELDLVKSENLLLKKEIGNLKTEISNNFQSNLSLRTENKHLYEMLEEFKTEAISIDSNSNDMVKAECIPLSEIVSGI